MIPRFDLFFADALREAERGDPWNDAEVHPSDLWHTLPPGPNAGCPRQLWLRTHGAERRPATPGQLLMLRFAHRIHEWLGAELELARTAAQVAQFYEGHHNESFRHLADWRLLGVEVTADDDGAEEGRLDALLEHPEEGRLVLDFKSMRGRAFQYLDGPKPGHVLQVQSYMRRKDARQGVLLYVDREGQNFMVQYGPLERDDAAVATAWAQARAIVALPTPPPAIAPKAGRKGAPEEPWVCTYCPHYKASCEGAVALALEGQLRASLEIER